MAGNLKQTIMEKYRKYKTVLMVIGILLISTAINGVFTGILVHPLYHYEPTKARVYDVKSTLRVEHWNDPVQFVELTLNSTFIDDQYKGFMVKEVYGFVNSNTNLNATFHHIYLVISIPQEAYEYFWQIECYWRVEEHEGIEQKSDNRFEFNGFDYIIEIDITREMNKDDVPERVESTVTLYSR